MSRGPTLQQIAEYYGVTDRTLRNWREKDPKLYRAAILGYNVPDDCTPERCSKKSVRELIEMKRWHTDAIRRSLEQIELIDELIERRISCHVNIDEMIRTHYTQANGALIWRDGHGRYLDDGELQALHKSGAFDGAKIVPMDRDLYAKAAKEAGLEKSKCDECVQIEFQGGAIWI